MLTWSFRLFLQVIVSILLSSGVASSSKGDKGQLPKESHTFLVSHLQTTHDKRGEIYLREVVVIVNFLEGFRRFLLFASSFTSDHVAHHVRASFDDYTDFYKSTSGASVYGYLPFCKLLSVAIFLS